MGLQISKLLLLHIIWCKFLKIVLSLVQNKTWESVQKYDYFFTKSKKNGKKITPKSVETLMLFVINYLTINLYTGLKSMYGDKAFSNTVPALWNKLPKTLRTSQSVATFKSHLNTYLFPK